MSDLELQDFMKALDDLKKYNKIYSLVEYTSNLHEGMTNLEKKI